MMNKYDHVHPNLVEILDLNESERIAWIKKSRWIGYPRSKQILAKLDDLLHHPRDIRMPNMLLIGESNNGKTHIVNHFLQLHPPNENLDGEHIIANVLYLQAPPNPNESSIYYEILSALFERVPSKSIDAQRSRTIEVLRQIQLKVLVIDELHNVLAGTTTKRQTMLNTLKYLGNELRISIVGCGTSDLLRAVSVDPQIQNRFPPEFLPNWKMGKEYLQLLKSFEYILPLRHRSNFTDSKMAGKILAMSEGLIGEVSALLNLAAIYAIKNRTECITYEGLQKCGFIPPSDRAKNSHV